MQESANSVLTFYRVDGKNRLLEVGGAWDDFARSNDGDRAIADRITGTNVLDHVSGDVSRMYVRTIFEAVRALERKATRAYRCDSPGQKRFMEMTVTLEDAGSLLVEHRLLKVQDLPRAIRFVAGAVTHKSTQIRCSMCSRLKHGAEWREPDSSTGDQGDNQPIAVVYGVCSSCLAEIRQYRLSNPV